MAQQQSFLQCEISMLDCGCARTTAFVEPQEKGFAATDYGFTAVKHRREVGASCFDDVAQVSQAGKSPTTALHGVVPRGQGVAGKRRP